MSGMRYRERCLAQKINVCNACGSDGELVVHHINGDQDDNRLDNLVPVCHGCHSKIHLGNNPKGVISRFQEKLPESTTGYGNSIGETKQIRLDVTEDEYQTFQVTKAESDAETNTELVLQLIKEHNDDS